MKKVSAAIFSFALIATSQAYAQTTSTSDSAAPPKKGGLGHDAKVVGGDVGKGTKTVFKDLGKGVKKIGTGIDKGAKVVGKDTEKGVSKLKPHKKSSEPSTSSTSQ